MTPEQYDAARVALMASGVWASWEDVDGVLALGGYHNPPRPCEGCESRQKALDAADAQAKSLDEALAEATDRARELGERAASLEQSLYHEANAKSNLQAQLDAMKRNATPPEEMKRLLRVDEEHRVLLEQINQLNDRLTRAADEAAELRREAAAQRVYGDAQAQRAKSAEDANSDMLRKIRKLEGKLAELEAQLQ